MIEQDVPSPINWQSPNDVAEWERTAQTRPGRAEMFESFLDELQALGDTNATVLELGSGTACLAAFLLDVLPTLRLTLMGFSAPMHWSMVLTGTGCTPAHRLASSIASVSVRSVLLRRTYGRTYWTGIKRTASPLAWQRRPQ